MTLDSENELVEVTRDISRKEVAKKISKLTKQEKMQGIYIKEEQENLYDKKLHPRTMKMDSKENEKRN